MATGTLTISLAKRSDGHVVLTLTRPDGSVTGGRLSFPAVHDLVHYAVESELGLKNAFYGLIARGYGLESFNVPAAAQRLNLPPEAIWTEFVVGQLQVEMNDGAEIEDFVGQLRASYPGWDAVELTGEKLARIRVRLGGLLERWRATKPGQSLVLEFSA